MIYLEYVFVEMVLQFFIRIVNQQLFKSVRMEILKSVNIENTDIAYSENKNRMKWLKI